ncbi:hypothetical protein RYH80_18150 [Halobaculum sp. MBLA0147]|uniref:hypothetical protein n=1 Tax=Halobaculum sp. MBLA0147 TaxID=3079934 RepID=UPI003526923B
MDMGSNSTSLDEYQPSRATDLSAPTSEPLADRVATCSSWETVLTINGTGPYVLGSPTDGRASHHLYDIETTAYRGFLELDSDYTQNDGAIDEDRYVALAQGQTPEAARDSPVVGVDSVTITEDRNPCAGLDAAVWALRDALTTYDHDPSEANPRLRTDYGDWIEAINEVATFTDNEVSTGNATAPLVRPDFLQTPKVMHALFRHPLDGSDVISQISTKCHRSNSLTADDPVTPEGVRQALVRAAAELADCDLPTPVTGDLE